MATLITCRSLIYLLTCLLNIIYHLFSEPTQLGIPSIRSPKSTKPANLTITTLSIIRWRNPDSPICLIWTKNLRIPIYHGNNSSLLLKKVVSLQLNTLHSVCPLSTYLPHLCLSCHYYVSRTHCLSKTGKKADNQP